jgi:hypothetical protein
LDDAVIAPALVLVERTVLEIADGDGRQLVQGDPPLGAVVDVTVEVVDAQKAAPFFIELFEVGTASHGSENSLRWAARARLRQTAEAIEPTSSTLEKVHVLADFLRLLAPELLRLDT